MGICDNIQKHIEQISGIKSNPYWEKWNRGRPSKNKLEKRKLYWQWQNENRPTVGFLNVIIGSGTEMIDKKRIEIQYKQRGNQI